MKKALTILAVLCALTLVLSLAACGKAPAPSSVPASVPASTPASVPASTPADPAAALPTDTTDGANALTQLSEEAVTMAQDVPDFLSADLQDLYRAAYYLDFHFTIVAGFDTDFNAKPIIADNGMEMHPDKEFASYSAFRKAMDSVFTPEETDAMLNFSQSYMDDGNDVLYSGYGSRGTNIFYTGSTFTLVSADESKIVMNMIAHYDEAMMKENNVSYPTEETFEITMVKTDAGWRFTNFELGQ
ncbi:MAG: hypothetical protein RSD27_02780 [Ruthenibacterium sp.]